MACAPPLAVLGTDAVMVDVGICIAATTNRTWHSQNGSETHSGVQAITFYAYGADDRFVNDTALDASANGGLGNDYLKGGTGSDRLVGDVGNDLLRGFSGDDLLKGGDGADRLYGGKGVDRLLGGPNRDSLFGGGASQADRLKGETGRDRFLLQPDDRAVDISSADNVIHFRRGVEYSRTNWTDAEIEGVDEAFAMMADRTGDHRLLDDVLTGDALYFEHGGYDRSDWIGLNVEDPYRDSSGEWQYKRTIYLSPSSGLSGRAEITEEMVDVTLHETGHNWEEEGPVWDDFKQISGWTQRNRSGDEDYRRGTDDTEKWWYLASADFASSYARTNPYEDFAETFHAYFTGVGRAAAGDAKIDMIDRLIAEV